MCVPLSPQNCIATHESNGIDIITALILNDINPLGKKRMDLVLELKASGQAQGRRLGRAGRGLRSGRGTVVALTGEVVLLH